MSLLVVGCNHRSAELPLLERLTVPGDELGKALSSLLELDHVLEAAVLSTCSRVEVYAHVARFHPGLAELRSWFSERGDVHPQEFDVHHYSYHDDRAAAHLFAVTCGLDSMIVGERQIALQVRQAMEAAYEQGSVRRLLLRLFRQAVQVGRRVRAETDLARGASSIVDVGLDVACEQLGSPLAGRRVLLVGAGKIGSLTSQRIAASGVAHADVWNRSEEKAARLAAKIDGSVVPDGGLGAAVAAADAVICTTGAPEPVIDRELVTRAVSGRSRSERPLVLLDLGMPRNIEPECGELDGVRLVDLGDVREVADRGVTGEVIAEAQGIVDEEAARFAAWTRARQVEPTIRAIRARADEVRRDELDRLARRLSTLDQRQREAVEALASGIVNTLLHGPTVRLKDLADRGVAEQYADALRELFDLDDDPGAPEARRTHG